MWRGRLTEGNEVVLKESANFEGHLEGDASGTGRAADDREVTFPLRCERGGGGGAFKGINIQNGS